MRIKDAKVGMKVKVCTSKEFSKGKIPGRYHKYLYWADSMDKTIGKTGTIISVESPKEIRETFKEHATMGVINVKISRQGSWMFFSCDVNPV